MQLGWDKHLVVLFVGYSKFYPKVIIQKELSTNKSRKKYYPEDLSKTNFIQRLT